MATSVCFDVLVFDPKTTVPPMTTATIGIVRHVARTAEGGRLVSVPIEAVAIFGRQLVSLDMKPAEYASAATWNAPNAELLGNEDKILIGLTRR
jgi:hypothetical protein